MSEMIRTRKLSKVFKGSEVVSQVDMTVRRGEIYGFLGPNGAGKSTIMKMLLNLIKPTEGEIELFGERLTPGAIEPFKRIGHIIETPVFYDKLTAERNLELHGEYMGHYNAKAVREALDLVQLRGIENKQVRQFSLGMKQRLGIARAISTKPELLILDEPINGLDPAGIQELRVLFKRLREEYGMTLLISSHILSEIEHIADTVGVIDGGKLIREVSMDRIHQTRTQYIEIVTDNVTRAAYVLEKMLGLRNFKAIDGRILRIYESDIQPIEISKLLIQNDVGVESINRHHDSLEDYFFQVIKGGSDNAASY